MDRRTAIAARNRLEELKLISVEKEVQNSGKVRITIAIIPIWDKNNEHYIEELKEAQNNNSSNKRDTPYVQNNNSSYVQNNNPSNNEKKVNKEHSVASEVGNGECAFIPRNGSNTSTQKKPPRIFSEKLYKALSEKNKIMRPPNIGQWSNTFRKFMIENELPSEEISTVLDWYIDHIGDEHVKHAYSANSFCTEYVKIRDAMDRDIHRDRDHDDPPKQIIKTRTIMMDGSVQEKG